MTYLQVHFGGHVLVKVCFVKVWVGFIQKWVLSVKVLNCMGMFCPAPVEGNSSTNMDLNVPRAYSEIISLL